MNAKLNKNGKAAFHFPANYNTALLVIEGSIIINEDEKVRSDHFVLFENEGESFKLEAVENSIVLIMSGEPLHEPIASHGPCVMNTIEEIRTAYNDYHRGKFGHLEE